MTNFNKSVEKELLKSLYNDCSIILQKKQSIIKIFKELSKFNSIDLSKHGSISNPYSIDELLELNKIENGKLYFKNDKNPLELNYLQISDLLSIANKIFNYKYLDSK